MKLFRIKIKNINIYENLFFFKILGLEKSKLGRTKQYIKCRIYEHKYSIRTENLECTS